MSMPDIPGFGASMPGSGGMGGMGMMGGSTPKKSTLPLEEQVYNKLDAIFKGTTDVTWELWKKLNGKYNPNAVHLT